MKALPAVVALTLALHATSAFAHHLAQQAVEAIGASNGG
jgi:hypothetical protein